MRTVLAVDGGNSKTDVALVREDGRLVAALRGPTTSHQVVGLDVGIERMAELVARVRGEGSVASPPEIGAFALAGADTARDVRALEVALEARSLATRTIVRNDTQGALRAGTDRGWGVVVICGAGVAAAGVAPDGRTARLAALGEISGDWGGGNDLGWAGIAAAVRAVDGRGPRSSLSKDVPMWFGLRSPAALTAAFYEDRVDRSRVGELAPLIFRAAAAGDGVARAIIDRQADEIVAMGGAMLRRLHLTRLDADVILAGGVFRTDDVAFWSRVRAGIRSLAPRAIVVRCPAPPVAGAVLLGLDELGIDVDRARRVRADLAAWDAACVRDRGSPR